MRILLSDYVSYQVLMSSHLLALLWCDFALTFPEEVDRIWRRKLTGPAVIYILIRHAFLLDSVFTVSQTFLLGGSLRVCYTCVTRSGSMLTFRLRLARSSSD